MQIRTTAIMMVVNVLDHDPRTRFDVSRFDSIRMRTSGSTRSAIVWNEGLSCCQTNMNNTPLIVACVISVVGCVGAAYLVDKLSPVPPIRDKDILETTSVVGIATLSKDAVAPLVQNTQDPKEIFNLYIAKTLTLEDALELLLKKGNDAGISELYAEVVKKIESTAADSDERAYYEAFRKALEKYYPSLAPKPAPESTPEPAPEPEPEPEEAEPEPERPDVASSIATARAATTLQTGGRRTTQKHRHPVIRNILCADA